MLFTQVSASVRGCLFIYDIIAAAEPCNNGFTVLSFHSERKACIDVIIGPAGCTWKLKVIRVLCSKSCNISSNLFVRKITATLSWPNCEHWWLSVLVHVVNILG